MEELVPKSTRVTTGSFAYDMVPFMTNGTCDYLVALDTVAFALRQSGLEIVPNTGKLYEGPLGVMVRKGNVSLWWSIKRALLRLFASGMMQELEQKYVLEGSGGVVEKHKYINHVQVNV